MQDIIGTGQFNGEYLVASKRYFDLDFSLGLVWGYGRGSDGLFSNPMTIFSNRFRVRSADVGRGGTLSLGNYFAGETVSLFGGIEYFTPLDGLSLKLEYDPNDFRAEPSGTTLGRDFPFNGAVVYRPASFAEMSLGLERGNRLMVRWALRANLHGEGITKISVQPPIPILTREAREALRRQASAAQGQVSSAPPPPPPPDPAAMSGRLFAAVESRGFAVTDVRLSGEVARLALTPRGADPARVTIVALSTAVAEALPVAFERFVFVVSRPGGEERRFEISRQEIRRNLMADALFSKLEALGFTVTSLAIGEDRVELTVGASEAGSEADYLAAARAIAELPSLKAHRVTVVGLRGAVEVARVTLEAATGRHEYRLGTETRVAYAERAEPPPPSPEILAKLAEIAFKLTSAQGFAVDAFDVRGREAIIHVTPLRYPQPARNVGRVARVVATIAPDPVEVITVVTLQEGVEVSRISILRRDLEHTAEARGSPEELWANANIGRGGEGISATAIRNDRYPAFSWSLGPAWRMSAGAPFTGRLVDPALAAPFVLQRLGPFTFQIWARLGAGVEFLPGLKLRGVVGRDIFNTFDRLTRRPKGNLEPVRSNLTKYLNNSELPLVRLQGDYIFSPARNFYARLSAGYFERMFGGIGGELLYRRQNARWAVGVHLNHVRQREFKQQFGFRDYQVTTGHLGLYYQFPFLDLEGSVHVGRYLAGDRGATFRLVRRFKSGVVVGAFFTRTNVSAEDFGEGSFDKGFFMTIPFDLILPQSTRRKWSIGFRPLTSDGGQMLEIGPKLYDVTADGQLDSIARGWSRFLD